MKNIIIINGNTDLNRGDQALIWESARVVQDIYDNDVSISLIESGSNAEDIERQIVQTRNLGYTFLSPILKHPNRFSSQNDSVQYRIVDYCKWGVIALFDLFASVLLLSRFSLFNVIGSKLFNKRDRQTVNAIKSADAIYIKGGGFMHSYGKFTDPYLTYYSLYLALLAIRYKKEIFILPNSIGPLKNSLSRFIIKYIFKRSKFVSARENISKQFVEDQLHIKCQLYSDLGYYLTKSEINTSEYLSNNNIPLDKPKVGITLRPYRFPESDNPADKYQNYIDSIVSFATYLSDKNYHVVFCAHTMGPSAHEQDQIAIEDVLKKLPTTVTHSYICNESLNCRDIMSIYSTFEYLVGTRFHSVIFSQNVNVPTIAISYGGNKGDGIMKDLKLDEFVIPMNQISAEKLISSFDKIIERKEEYKESLHRLHLTHAKERESLINDISALV